jgi:orotidine-5'-phosphate decarboxylase
MDFIDKLLGASRTNKSLLCVGLDPDLERMPDMSIISFNRAIIDATSDLVCAYKPNLAFYEAAGIKGLEALRQTVEYIPDHIPVIGDAKRSDIGNTAEAYAKALFSTFGFDATTVNPYLGFDAIEPFIKYEEKGVFILCRTSNQGATDFQDIIDSSGTPLYETVALKSSIWNTNGNVGLVVGATYPRELQRIRKLCPTVPLLIPGIGAQGGDVALSIEYGVDERFEKAIINVSRQVLYASGGTNFARAARQSAQGLRDRINETIDRIRG